MPDFAETYKLSRGRYNVEIADLSTEQLNWKPSPDALSIAEMSVHLAGVEIWFSQQIKGVDASPTEEKIIASAVDGVVNDKPFPYPPEELTQEFVGDCLAQGEAMVTEILTESNPEWRKVEMKSALGPIITGEGAMQRFCFHPAYHHGQVYLYKNMKGFPS